MFQWFKKVFGNDEFMEEIESLQLDKEELNDKVDELTGIVNSRKSLRCEARDCMDFVDYSCSLKEISINPFGKCLDYFPSSEGEEELKSALNPSLVK